MRAPLVADRRGLAAVLVAAVLTMLASASPASAHDSTDGSTVITIEENRVVVGAAVAFAEVGFTDTSGDGLIDADELAAQRDAIASTLVTTVRDHVALSVDGEPLQIIGAGVPSPSEFESNDDGASPYVGLVLASDTHHGDITDVALDWTFEGLLVLTLAVAPRTTPQSPLPQGTITWQRSTARRL